MSGVILVHESYMCNYGKFLSSSSNSFDPSFKNYLGPRIQQFLYPSSFRKVLVSSGLNRPCVDLR